MAMRCDRMIAVMQTTEGVLISFSWIEANPGDLEPLKYRFIELNRGAILESVSKALNILAPVWSPEFFSDGKLLAYSERVTNQVEKFDMIIDAEEPHTVLVSRYILEA